MEKAYIFDIYSSFNSNNYNINFININNKNYNNEKKRKNSFQDKKLNKKKNIISILAKRKHELI